MNMDMLSKENEKFMKDECNLEILSQELDSIILLLPLPPCERYGQTFLIAPDIFRAMNVSFMQKK